MGHGEYRLAMYDELAAELARMAADDQRIRKPLRDARTMVRRLDAKRAMEYQRIDGENTNRLLKVPRSQTLGEFPGTRLVALVSKAVVRRLVRRHSSRR